MALYINKQGPFHVAWTSTQKATLKHADVPTFSYADLNKPEVQADGHELQLILDHFEGIPYTKGRVVVWEGELARFIIRNLP